MAFVLVLSYSRYPFLRFYLNASLANLSHVRSALIARHTTADEHMPEKHRRMGRWTPERFTRWAEKIGPSTGALITTVLGSRRHPQQAFRSCLGILRLAKSYGDARLEAAARRALAIGANSYRRLPRLLTELAIARADGSYPKLLASLAKTEVLIIDDFGLAKLSAENRRDLLEITEDRYGIRSTVITSQLPVENWHDIIGDPTLADAILDRLVHSSYQLNLKGESMRKRRQPLTQTDHRDS